VQFPFSNLTEFFPDSRSHWSPWTLIFC
jgi:hypothetical protein